MRYADGAAGDPAQIELHRLVHRRRLIGQTLELDAGLRDYCDLQNPLALAPAYPWEKWQALHPSWLHGELLRGHRWAAIVSGATDGVVLRTYSRIFLDDLVDVVRAMRPLMESRGIIVPVWCEGRSRKWAGSLAPTMELDGVFAPQSITLSSWRTLELSDECGRTIESRAGYSGFAELCFFATHELAHASPSDGEEHRDPDEFLGHGNSFQTRWGLLLDEFLRTDTVLSEREKRIVIRRAWSADPKWGRPICPVEGQDWGEDYQPWVCPSTESMDARTMNS